MWQIDANVWVELYHCCTTDQLKFNSEFCSKMYDILVSLIYTSVMFY